MIRGVLHLTLAIVLLGVGPACAQQNRQEQTSSSQVAGLDVEKARVIVGKWPWRTTGPYYGVIKIKNVGRDGSLDVDYEYRGREVPGFTGNVRVDAQGVPRVHIEGGAPVVRWELAFDPKRDMLWGLLFPGRPHGTDVKLYREK